MPPFWQGGLQTPVERSNKRVHGEYSRDGYLSMSGIVNSEDFQEDTKRRRKACDSNRRSRQNRVLCVK